MPERTDALILSVQYGDKLPARVLERGANTLLVAITVPAKRLSGRDLEGLVLEYAGASGRVRLTGTAPIEDPKEPDVLRLDALRAVEVLQEREFVRIRAARPVRLFVGKELQPIETFTIDVSGGGLLLAGPETLRIGEQLRFQLTVTQGERADHRRREGRTQRRQRSPRGRASRRSATPTARRLVRFIFECQRTELRLGLKQGGGMAAERRSSPRRRPWRRRPRRPPRAPAKAKAEKGKAEKGTKGKDKKDDKGAKAAAGDGEGPSVAGHPRAVRRSRRRSRGAR